MRIPGALKDPSVLYKRIDARSAKYGKISKEEILHEIEEYRSKQRKRQARRDGIYVPAT